MTDKYSCLITHGVEFPLENIPFHGKAPLKRILMSGSEAGSNFNLHIAIHVIGEQLPFEYRSYSQSHAHNCDEWNIIIGDTLEFEIMLNDEKYIVKSPATIYIPKGTVHSANVLEGKGIFIAILDTIDYNNSFIV